ncbi:hypothetical protein [Corynebacterium pygosceleis]|uniref:hypothetical protein n=1 Tax=Corynebacterium pygosceleis TaxID=2800406 RepID=UPI0020044E4A|nr:hypothetical protein [Corynebacterium pygosceleis]MCK7675241.1 hypothetical protein [Corynebacterium pygosceleis]
MPVVRSPQPLAQFSQLGSLQDSPAVWLSVITLIVLTATAVYATERGTDSAPPTALLCAALCLLAPVIGPVLWLLVRVVILPPDHRRERADTVRRHR